MKQKIRQAELLCLIVRQAGQGHSRWMSEDTGVFCAELRDKLGSPGRAEPGEKLMEQHSQQCLMAASLCVGGSVVGEGMSAGWEIELLE